MLTKLLIILVFDSDFRALLMKACKIKMNIMLFTINKSDSIKCFGNLILKLFFFIYLKNQLKIYAMKKTFVILSVLAISAIAMSSCKKDYVCECTYTSALGTVERTEVLYDNSTKSQAEDACTNYTLPGANSFDCNLK